VASGATYGGVAEETRTRGFAAPAFAGCALMGSVSDTLSRGTVTVNGLVEMTSYRTAHASRAARQFSTAAEQAPSNPKKSAPAKPPTSKPAIRPAPAPQSR
jgi:hypothetical protein